MATLTPQAFAQRWGESTLSERSSYQQHFLDLCEVLGAPKPADVDRAGEFYTFEKGVEKTGGGKGFADVWYRDHFAIEYKGNHRDLSAAYKNPADDVDAPRVHTKEVHPLTQEEARRFLEAVRSDRLEALYVVALHTGLRQGELLALRWEDLDLEAHTLQVRRTVTKDGGKLAVGPTKTAKGRRTVKLTKDAAASLRGHLTRQLEEIDVLGDHFEDQGLVFCTSKGTLINPTNLRKRSFAPLLFRAGLPHTTFHQLRHTAATILLLKNVNPKIVSEMLGHASIAITLDTYSHVLPNMQDSAVAAMEEAFA